LKELLRDRLPVSRALSIFCGHGENEIRLAQFGVFQECLALDISVGAIGHARQAAIQQGVTNVVFQCEDLNQPDTLSPNEFDLVIANGALHHAMNLKDLITQVKRAMKLNALFLSSEYIGPDREGKTFRQQQLIRALQTLIPPNLRKTKNNLKGRLKGHIRSLVDSVGSSSRLFFRIFDAIQRLRIVMRDPSEAVHSSQIVDAIRSTFPNVEVRYFGGALLSSVITTTVMDALDITISAHRELIETLIRFEELAEEFREVPPANAFFIAWNQ